MNKSPSARLVHFIFAVIFTLGVGALSFVWSLGNTVSFTRDIMLDDTWGTVMGFVIQFGPQVFLALAASAVGTERTAWFGAFILFSAMDASTNIGATISRLDAGVQMNALQLAVRIFIDIIIVFGEEMVGYGISIVFHDLAELIESLGEEAPGWMFVAEDTASRLGTGHGVRRQAGKQASKRGMPPMSQ